MFRDVLARLQWFFSDARATVSVETVLVFPMLAWWYMGAFVFFDAYRSYNISVKASYVVGDIISRSRDVVQPDFLDGLDGLVDRIVLTSGNPAIRVSGVRYDKRSGGRYVLVWSHATGDVPQMDQATLDSLRDKWIPVMADQEMIVMVETVVPYTPPFNLGVDLTGYWRGVDFNPGNWYNVVINRPRFTQQLLLAPA